MNGSGILYVARVSYFTWIGATKCALKPSNLYSDFTAISLYTVSLAFSYIRNEHLFSPGESRVTVSCLHAVITLELFSPHF